MEFGIQFFPAVRPADKSGQQYWNEALHLTGLCDELGYTNVRTVEHYFQVGGIEIASLQVNFNTISVQDAERSMRLFAEEVIPHFRRESAVAS